MSQEQNKRINSKELNVLILAYLGDSIYESYVREELIKRNIANVDKLQKESINYVSAKSQAAYLNKLIQLDFFNDEEKEIIKRGRNHKNSRHPKNCDIVTYKFATALESLIGYLYIENKTDRIKEIMKQILKVGEE